MEKTVWRFFSARAHRDNAADLDRLSREGWNLKKAGWLRYTLEQSGSVYRYGLDYCPADFDQQPGRKNAYAEAGWELVSSTLSGWDYYRKPFDPDLPEEAYRLPTPYTPEHDGLLASVSRWFWLRNVAAVIAAPLAVVAVVRQKSMVIPAVIYLAAVLGCFFRMQALQARLRACGKAYETPKPSES